MIGAPPRRNRGGCCQAVTAIEPGQGQATAALLRALSDSTRLGMLATLWKASAPVCICDFTAAYGLSQPTISHHMAKLKMAGLVRSRRQGIWVFYQRVDEVPPEVESLVSGALAHAGVRHRAATAPEA